MDRTPKMRKNINSLQAHLNRKHYCESETNNCKSQQQNTNNNRHKSNNTYISVDTDCASPNSCSSYSTVMELSPRIPEIYHSPSQFFSSQTWAIESSEVGWKWNPQNNSPLEPHSRTRILTTTGTPDSTGAADSSYNSASSGSTNAEINQINGIPRLQQPSHPLHLHRKQLTRTSRSFWREKNCRKLDLELRLKEEARAEQTLKQRCDKLQEHLKSAGTTRQNNINNKIHIINNNNIKFNEIHLQKENNNNNILSKEVNNENIMPYLKNSHLSATIDNIENSLSLLKANDDSNHLLMGDFFNDSLSDDLLLAATQEIESKLETKSMETEVNEMEIPILSPKTECETPTSSRKKEPRSSFYMKFLEDDCPDDWFASLDEAVLKATQPARTPRSPFQRYKSMPVDNRRTSPCGSLYLTDNHKTIKTELDEIDGTNRNRKGTPNKTESRAMKRHASEHMLSPPTTSVKLKGRRYP